jgi:hypothetical protein
MKILAKCWLKSAAMAVAIVGYAGGGAWAELIHQWDFEETIGTGPVDTDGGPDTFSQNLNLSGISPAGPTATQVNNTGTSAPLGLGGQALKTGDGSATTVGGQNASIFNSAGVPGLGFKGFAAGTASVWVYRTADQQVGNNHSTILTIERDGSTGAAGRASIQVVQPNSTGGLPTGRVTGGITLSGREGPGNSGRMTYLTNTAEGNLVPLNTWTHIVAVWDYAVGDSENPTDGLDNGIMALYVNGLPISTGTFGGTAWPEGGANVTSLSALDSNGIVLGTGNANPTITAANQDEFEGLIDGVRLYNTRLSDADVLSLFRSYAVPEPSSLALLALGMLAIAGRRRVA